MPEPKPLVAKSQSALCDVGVRGDKGELPADSINGKVEQALIGLAVRRKEFGRKPDAGKEGQWWFSHSKR